MFKKDCQYCFFLNYLSISCNVRCPVTTSPFQDQNAQNAGLIKMFINYLGKVLFFYVLFIYFLSAFIHLFVIMHNGA